ncbi:uncharacterized protein [Macrobrachium rosenbergii]|uniref:uncharacterized protein isoform X7 n=1 Tax=Macrobrachium rosenbergii TaxID=79674 RepID=UPI0034D4ECA0
MAYGGRETPQMALDRAIGAGVVEERRDSTFYCNVCGTALKSKDTVKAHLRTKVHSENSADYDCAPRRTTVQLQNAMPREPSRKSTSVRPLQDTSKDSVTNDDLERAIKLGIVTEPLGPGDSYYCSSCEKPLKTKQTMRAHLSTSTHLSKLQNIMPREPSRKSTSVRPLQDTSKDSVTNDDLERAIKLGIVTEPLGPGDSYYCSSCEKPLKTKQTMRAHLSTSTHLSKLQNTLPREPSSKSTSVRPLQDTFKDSVTNGDLEKAIILGVVTEPKNPGDSYYCSSCKKPLKTKQTMRAHLSTPTHLSKTDVKNKDPQRAIKVSPQSFKSAGLPNQVSNSSGSDSCEGNEDERLVSKAMRDGILQEDTLSNSLTPYWCNICLQALKQYERLASHLHSKKHRAKVEACCPVPQQEKDWEINLSNFEYRNDYASKGRVFVFNVLKSRPGAEADTRNIKETFQRLGYEVSIQEDFTKKRLYSEIEMIQKDKTLKDVRALIVFILSHGQDIETFLCSDDQTANLNDIKRGFTHSNCPVLKGKPKIFFANFCRGRDIEIYMHDAPDTKVEALVDTVVVHASNEGMKALRSKDKGTLFVQSLCEVLSSTEISKQFRVVYHCLYRTMASKRGTTPMLTDYVFKEFTF